ncbi:MAG: hypothetical protein QOG83_2386 [Alphaproteobacteria bacterium]|jgi:hypothetical protein|nr:hypothetical protein [Alphaproteobacteria bacterium]
MEASEKLTLARTEIARIRVGDLTGFAIEFLVSLLNELEQRVTVSVAPVPTVVRDSRPIWERIADITARVPAEEWEKLPTDLAANHDHYLYGAPKRE